MDIEPKFKIIGTVILFGVSAGLALFMLGRVTAGAPVTSWLIGTGVGLLILAAVGVAVLRHLPASVQFEGVLLKEGQPSDEGFVSAPTRVDLIGQEGFALSDLRPIGTAVFADERVDVTTDGEYIAKDTRVRVVRADNMKVVVRAAPRLNA